MNGAMVHSLARRTEPVDRPTTNRPTDESATGLRDRRPRGRSSRTNASPSSSRSRGPRSPIRTRRCSPRSARRWSAPPLRELVRAGQRIAISVCDITRAQPRREMLMALFEEMPQVRPEDVTILIATGTHRTNTPRRARAHARPRHPQHVSRHQSRLPRSLVARTRRA